jgi:hypothetical protein
MLLSVVESSVGNDVRLGSWINCVHRLDALVGTQFT